MCYWGLTLWSLVLFKYFILSSYTITNKFTMLLFGIFLCDQIFWSSLCPAVLSYWTWKHWKNRKSDLESGGLLIQMASFVQQNMRDLFIFFFFNAASAPPYLATLRTCEHDFLHQLYTIIVPILFGPHQTNWYRV